MIKLLHIVLILWTLKTILNATSMIGSKHDLSMTNFYGPYPGASTEICVFCHTPHAANNAVDGPLWNRKVSDTSAFTLYSGEQGVPNSPSMVCLSCHDGVSANGEMSAVNAEDTHYIINSPGPGHADDPATPNCYACHFNSDGGSIGETYPDSVWTIGPNLTDDHPVSVSYEDAKAARPGKFQNTPLNDLKLYDGNVECSSCHDPHMVDTPTFLRVSNQNSDLCKSCHIK